MRFPPIAGQFARIVTEAPDLISIVFLNEEIVLPTTGILRDYLVQ